MRQRMDLAHSAPFRRPRPAHFEGKPLLVFPPTARGTSASLMCGIEVGVLTAQQIGQSFHSSCREPLKAGHRRMRLMLLARCVRLLLGSALAETRKAPYDA